MKGLQVALKTEILVSDFFVYNRTEIYSWQPAYLAGYCSKINPLLKVSKYEKQYKINIEEFVG